MKQDLTNLLNQWPYDPEHTTRIIAADDGRSVLQVRLPLGIEQYELEGRPDGTQPDGYPTYVNKVEDRLRSHIVEHGSDLGFAITKTDAEELQREGALFYYRYLLLFQLNHHLRVIRDTEHNLHLCDLLERYCEEEDSRNAVLQFRPYILRMHAAAKGFAAATKEIEGDAVGILDEAIDAIQALEEIDTPAFQFERVRSTNYLKVLRRKLARRAGHRVDPEESDTDLTDPGAGAEHGQKLQKNHGPMDVLQQELSSAIEHEDYERAAELRDRIRRLEGRGRGQ